MVTNNTYTNRTIISTNRIGDGGVYGGLETGATDSVSVNWDWAFDPSPSLAVQSDGSLSGLAAVKGGGHGLNGHSVRLAPVSYTAQYWDQAAESLALETRTTGLPAALSYITNTTGEAALLWGKPGERVVAATFEVSDYTVATGAGAYPSVTVAVDPWLDPCLCELEPSDESAVNPAAAVALWEHNSSYVNASATASFAWDEVSWTGGAFNPCEWEDVSLMLTLEGEGVDGHSFVVKPKQVSAYFWIPASGADGGHWSLVQLSESETEALGHIFTAFRGPGDHEGAPEYDPDGGGQILPGAPAYLGATNLHGELPFQQICYANTVYVTQSVTLEGTDTLVL